MARRHHNADQYRLPFGAAEADAKTAFVAKLAAVSPETAGVSGAVWGNLSQLLESLFFFSDRDPSRFAQPSPEALRENADLTRSVVSRTIKAGRELALLRTERPRTRRGQKRSPDRVWILHQQIDRLVELSRDARRGSDAPASAGDAPSGSSGIRWDQVGSGGIRWDHIEESSSPPSLSSSNPPPTPAPAPPGTSPHGVDIDVGAPGGWGEVLEILKRLRVKRWREATAAARSAGASPGEVMAIVDAFVDGMTPAPPAWGPAGLAWAIERYEPGTPAASALPPACNEHQQAKDRVARESRRRREGRQAADRLRRREDDAAAKAAQRERLQQLEAIARELGEGVLREWASELDPFTRRLVANDPFGPAALSQFGDRLEAVGV